MNKFDKFRRQFLMAALQEQSSGEVHWMTVGSVCEKHGILYSAEPAAIAAALHLIQDEGLGLAEMRDDRLQFRFSAKGYAEASRLRDRGILQFLASFSRSDWIALGAFIVSIIALFKKA